MNLIYQDISQRNQTEIFIKIITKYLKKEGQGLLMVKARSIDASLKPKQAYKLLADKIREYGFTIIHSIDLLPCAKDHAAIVISF